MAIYRHMFVKHPDRLGLVARLVDVGAIWAAGYAAAQLRFPKTAGSSASIHDFIPYFSCTDLRIIFWTAPHGWTGRNSY